MKKEIINILLWIVAVILLVVEPGIGCLLFLCMTVSAVWKRIKDKPLITIKLKKH